MASFLTGISLIIVALAFILLAWRQRRALLHGYDPHCNRCLHNLTGLPKDSTRCPECGAELGRADAISHGRPTANRVRQALLLMGTLACGIAAWYPLRATDYGELRLRVTPTSWLLAESNRMNATTQPGVRNVAARELDRRIQAGRYSGDDLIDLVKAMHVMRVSGRPTVRSGDKWPVMFEAGPMGMWSSPSDPDPRYYVVTKMMRYRFGDGPWVTQNLFWDRSRSAMSLRTHNLDLPPDLPVGSIGYEATFAVRLIDARANQPLGDRYLHFLHQWDQSVATKVTVLPSDANDIALVVDPTHRTAIAASIQPSAIWRSERIVNGRGVRLNGLMLERNSIGDIELNGFLKITSPPVGVAFDVFLRSADGREIPIGSVKGNVGQTIEVQVLGNRSAATALLEEWSASRGDLILKPSVAAARRDRHLVEIWGEEIVIPNVRIWRVGVDHRDDTVEAPPATLPWAGDQ